MSEAVRERRKDSGDKESREIRKATPQGEEARGHQASAKAGSASRSVLKTLVATRNYEEVREKGKHNGNEESKEIQQTAQEGKEARGYQALAQAGGASRSLLSLFAK
jgi:hypothetical protein